MNLPMNKFEGLDLATLSQTGSEKTMRDAQKPDAESMTQKIPLTQKMKGFFLLDLYLSQQLPHDMYACVYCTALRF